MRIIIFLLTLVKISFAVQCDSNPCALGGEFLPPNYNCYQLVNNLDVVVCTCPNGRAQVNAPCRVCDFVNCGFNGFCIEQPTLNNLYYLCACTNGTYNYAIPGPCPDPTTTTTTTTTTTITTVTTTTTLSSINCLNNGIYDAATGRCICQISFTGIQCETSIGQELCRNIYCANSGICNPVPAANSNGVEAQCWCINGTAGTNCELIGISTRCTSNLCQNSGTCEEKVLGSSLYAYCHCRPGFDGQCCQNNYFGCPNSGLFMDTVNCKFGRYYQCIGTTIIPRLCPLGQRFNSATMQCDSNGSCPS